MISFTLLQGTATVEDAIVAIDELLQTIVGDRKTEAILLGALAQLRAMSGSFDEARRLYRRGQEILTELSAGLDASTTSIDSARVELLAGDLEAAEAELRRDDAALKALGETYFRSYVVGMLAQVLARTGRFDEADGFATVAEEITEEDDVASLVAWKSARASIAANAGDPAAVDFARSAVDVALGTANIELQADAYLDLATTLTVLGQPEEAQAALVDAINRYARKGDTISAERAREQLDAMVSPMSANSG